MEKRKTHTAILLTLSIDGVASILEQMTGTKLECEEWVAKKLTEEYLTNYHITYKIMQR